MTVLKCIKNELHAVVDFLAALVVITLLFVFHTLPNWVKTHIKPKS